MGFRSLLGRKRAKPTDQVKVLPVEREPGFPELGGQPYLDFLTDCHARLRPRLYLEIGTQRGRSLALAQCTSIAIDPEFRIENEAMGTKPALYLMQQTSDAFFESDFLSRNRLMLDFAFLDGMHLFEFLLRDFMNTERWATEAGAIAMHDCIPFARIMADRDVDPNSIQYWTGDVWKLLPILRRYRSDLDVNVLDCPPTGLVIVRGLDPRSTVLSDAYDQILRDYMNMSLDDYGVPNFVSELSLIDAPTFWGRAEHA